MPRLKVISFDLDNTLLDFDRTLRVALQAVAEFLTDKTGRPISAYQLHQSRNELAAIPSANTMRLLDMRRLSFARLLEDTPSAPHVIDEAMTVFTETRFSRMYVYPEAGQTLRILADNFRLAAVTNGNTNPERTDLAGLFEQVVYAEDLAFEKPDPRIFALMLERMGVENANSVCHVGDSLVSDISGGNAAGLVTAWFNPGRTPNTTDIVPNYEVTSLLALPKLMKQHGWEPD